MRKELSRPLCSLTTRTVVEPVMLATDAERPFDVSPCASSSPHDLQHRSEVTHQGRPVELPPVRIDLLVSRSESQRAFSCHLIRTRDDGTQGDDGQDHESCVRCLLVLFMKASMTCDVRFQN
jgi:hypothetical protein